MTIIKNPYNNAADEALVPLIHNGKTEAFAELYSRYGQKMYGYFYKMLWRNKELAEDFTQDLFVKLINNAAGFSPDKNFATWIYSIANNMCKNEYRNNETRAKHLAAQTMQVVTEAKDADVNRFKMAVHQCTNALSQEKRTLYILRFQENLSVPDISKIMDIPEGTIKSRIFYLLKEMKTQLKDFENLIIYP